MEDRIIVAFKEILKSDAIEVDDNVLEFYAKSANGSIIKPQCILYPNSISQIISIVNIANQHKLKLFPISRGMNWGYGAAQATSEDQVIVDLQRMNSIKEVNTELGTMTLEPGVSQMEAFEFLQDNHLDFYQLDVTGAGKNASVVGNMLERGFGHTDYGDRYRRIINMKIVTGKGELIDTSFGGMINANASNTYGYGIGPHINGIFTQSNFGIVVEMTIELMPKPEKFCMFLVTVKKKSDFDGLIKAIKELRLLGIVNSTVHIANKARTVGKKQNRFAGYWNAGGSLSGPSQLVNAKKKLVSKVLNRHLKNASCRFITDKTLAILNRIDKVKNLSFLEDLTYICDLQKGIPTDVPLKILFDDSENSVTDFSIKNLPSYFRWIPAVCRADAKSTRALLELIEKKFDEYGYEFRVTATFINPRTLTFISNISYAKDEESIKKADEFYDVLMKELAENGFYPYRTGSGMFSVDNYRDKVTTRFLQDIKKITDPNLTIAPNKYGI